MNYIKCFNWLYDDDRYYHELECKISELDWWDCIPEDGFQEIDAIIFELPAWVNKRAFASTLYEFCSDFPEFYILKSQVDPNQIILTWVPNSFIRYDVVREGGWTEKDNNKPYTEAFKYVSLWDIKNGTKMYDMEVDEVFNWNLDEHKKGNHTLPLIETQYRIAKDQN